MSKTMNFATAVMMTTIKIANNGASLVSAKTAGEAARWLRKNKQQ